MSSTINYFYSNASCNYFSMQISAQVIYGLLQNDVSYSIHKHILKQYP